MSPRGRLFSDCWRHEPPTKQFLSGGEANRGAVITNETPLLGVDGCLSNQAHLITQRRVFVNRITSRSLLFASLDFTRVESKTAKRNLRRVQVTRIVTAYGRSPSQRQRSAAINNARPRDSPSELAWIEKVTGHRRLPGSLRFAQAPQSPPIERPPGTSVDGFTRRNTSYSTSANPSGCFPSSSPTYTIYDTSI
ncbi:hypothetical protein CEP54_003206 [Fusarium duplospermum]|uniref:Uncharacterized protein n=1 Tax=Fusarium duplospermum TaxID=1325734 RepID=A0A428QQA9_9HYPO|nr:hypothetical protein CEP54_003206 [Fusarium duplospermum]